MSSVFRGFLLKIVVIAEASRRLEMMAEDGKHLIADTRARACNKKLGNGAGRFFPNLSDTPEEERRNAAHRNFVPQTNHRVPRFMDEHAYEERHSGHRAHQQLETHRFRQRDCQAGGPPGQVRPRLAPTIVEALAKQLDACVEVLMDTHGTLVSITHAPIALPAAA